MTDFKIQKDCITICQPTNKNQLPKSKNNSDYWFKQKRPTNKLNRLSDTDKRTLLIIAIQKAKRTRITAKTVLPVLFAIKSAN